MFEVNRKFKVADSRDSELEEVDCYHMVSYRWNIPLFIVTFDEIQDRGTSSLIVQAAGTLGLFAILKFHESTRYIVREIEVRIPNAKNQKSPWVTKNIVEAFEGQLIKDGELINGIKYVCSDSSVIYYPQEIEQLDQSLFTRCIHTGSANA